MTHPTFVTNAHTAIWKRGSLYPGVNSSRAKISRVLIILLADGRTEAQSTLIFTAWIATGQFESFAVQPLTLEYGKMETFQQGLLLNR